MKTIKLFLITSLFFTFGVQAQEYSSKNIPTVVHQEFAKHYPNMFAYEWEYKKKKGYFEAEFIDKGREMKAYFWPDGKWIQTKTEIKKTELSAEIWKSLSETNYQNWKVDDVDLFETPTFSEVYRLELKNGKQKLYLYFLANGKQVNLN